MEWSWTLKATQAGNADKPIKVRLRSYLIDPAGKRSEPIAVDVLEQRVAVKVSAWAWLQSAVGEVQPVYALLTAMLTGVLALWAGLRK